MLDNIKRKLTLGGVLEQRRRLSAWIAKWRGNAISPVMLMIDDLSNACVRIDETLHKARGDWGGLHDSAGSIFQFLERNLFSRYPEVRTTFFLVAGAISQYTYHQPFISSRDINSDEESASFFRRIFSDPRFEIAYHGLNHGKPGAKTENFVQEWKSFESIDSALAAIQTGLEICAEVFGESPKGGKYGGWEYNKDSDESIDRSGFQWWCRDWMPRDVTGSVTTAYYEPQMFGENRVIALPSTVHGGKWTKQQIKKLLSERQIISIEEHIAPERPDGLIQTPNVYDDIKSLQSLFTYLKDKNVWYATGSEIANYFEAFVNSEISNLEQESFCLCYRGRRRGTVVTLMVQPREISSQRSCKFMLTCPDGGTINPVRLSKNGILMFNVKVQSGRYLLKRS